MWTLQAESRRRYISGIDLVDTKAHLAQLQQEKQLAVVRARHYCDLVEKLRTSNRHLKNQLYYTVEAVRNYWRNDIMEEQTMGGKTLVASLKKPLHSMILWLTTLASTVHVMLLHVHAAVMSTTIKVIVTQKNHIAMLYI